MVVGCRGVGWWGVGSRVVGLKALIGVCGGSTCGGGGVWGLFEQSTTF